MAETEQTQSVTQPQYSAFATSCDCKSCKDVSRLQIERPLSLAEAKQKALDDNAKTVQQTASLEHMLHDHGDAIAAYWRSRKTDQRKSILRMIFPDMQDTKKEQEVFSHNAFMWPEDKCNEYRPGLLLRCLNIDRLASAPEPLLAMLWFRANLPASSWTVVDHENLNYAGLWLSFLKTSHAEGSFFITQSRFGQWTPYNKDLWHNKTAFPTPLALLLFDTQSIKAAMFLKIAQTLWNRAQNSPKCQHLRGHDVLKASAQSSSRTGWETLRLSTNSPTSPPPFNVSAIEGLVETWHDVARDDMLCRMHYTEYFYEDAKFWRDHDIGKQQDRSEEWKQQLLAFDVMFQPYARSLFWTLIRDEVSKLKEIHKQYEANIQPDFSLPAAYQEQLEAVGALASMWLDKIVKCMQQEHDRIAGKEWKSSYYDKNAKLYRSDKLKWCLYTLSQKRRRLPISLALAQLDEHLQKQPGDYKSIDPAILDWAEEAGAISKILAMLTLHRPAVQPFHPKDPEPGVGLDNYVTDRWDDRPWMQFQKHIMGDVTFNDKVDKLFGALLKDLTRLKPASGPKDEEWLATDHASRAYQSRMWEVYTDLHEKNLQSLGPKLGRKPELRQRDIDLMLSPLRQSPPSEVLASIEDRRTSIQSRISDGRKKSVAESTISDASSSVSHHSGEEKGTPGSKLAIREKEKEKTRGEADPVRSEPEEPEAPAPTPAAPAVVPVSQTTYDFLENLFEPKRPESWTDFQRAMEDVGFQANNAGGSIVDFTGVERKRVAFHKPHGQTTKLEVFILRNIRVRLSRHFGWTLESFKVRENED